MALFWVVALCSLVEVTDVSEMLAPSITRAMGKPRAVPPGGVSQKNTIDIFIVMGISDLIFV
jgi:hypothetical protein